MAPSTKITKVTKPGGKDIRMFFGAIPSSQKTSTQASGSGSQPKDAIEISDDDSKVTKKTANSRKRPSEPKALKVLDARINPSPVKEPSPAKRRKAVDSDEDEEEDMNQARRSRPRKKMTVMDSSEDESPAKTATKSAVGPKAKPRVSDIKKPRKSTSQLKTKRDEEFIIDSDESEVESLGAEDYLTSHGKKPRLTVAKTKATKAKAEDPPMTSVKGKEKEKQESKAKFDWAAAKAAKLAGQVAHGSKQVPDGVPNALAGLSFVFTGELSSFSREEAVDLAKRYGGRVVGQPSSKTDFVVLGDNAGPSKIAAIKKHGIRTVSEDEFLALIGSRKGGKVDEKTKKKMEKEEAAIKAAARELEKREEEEEKRAYSGSNKSVDPKSQLWTTRYAPQSLKEICGNKAQVEKLQLWLREWQDSKKANFKKPGKNGMNVYRAVMITGSPGIGKTTSAHLCAQLEGYTPIELNASDVRSKKLVENGMNVNNTSLDKFVGSHDTNSLGVTITDKTCLIMDEVDGMSSGDRGGVGALNALIKKTQVLTMSRPQVAMVRSRILTIAFKEKMKIPANVIDQLIAGAQSDIRQVLNMLSTWKLSSSTMDFDEGKNL
ncbi:hypothetical protein C0989_004989 [Termitomyces sp. Mn162]|nr:hypothetical protein C0989_004989 [Termitomyces sp. Mn162]